MSRRTAWCWWFVISETLEDLKGKMKAWKAALEIKEVRVNVKETKIMISSENARKVAIECKFPCAVCKKGSGSNSILSLFWSCWVHKRCSGITGNLKEDSKFKCHSLLHLMHAIAHTHASTLVYDTYLLGHWNGENDRKIKNVKLNSWLFFFNLC